MKPEDIKYIEQEIKTLISKIENTYYYELVENDLDPRSEEYPGFTRSWIKDRIRSLYYLITAYLEAKEMTSYLREFCSRFRPIIEDKNSDLMTTIVTHPEVEPELKMIVDFKQILRPFKFFDYTVATVDEIAKLKSILKHTDYILRRVGKIVKNETDIYEEVKWVLDLYYPSCRKKNKASFIHEFKTYNPDILVPELKTAIEYKYIKGKAASIDEYIDQIRIDATNYTDDHRFENFIAVIYIEDGSLATDDSIIEAWKQKRFPPNWEPIIARSSVY